MSMRTFVRRLEVSPRGITPSKSGLSFDCLFCNVESGSANVETRHPRCLKCHARFYEHASGIFRTGRTVTELR